MHRIRPREQQRDDDGLGPSLEHGRTGGRDLVLPERNHDVAEAVDPFGHSDHQLGLDEQRDPAVGQVVDPITPREIAPCLDSSPEGERLLEPLGRDQADTLTAERDQCVDDGRGREGDALEDLSEALVPALAHLLGGAHERREVADVLLAGVVAAFPVTTRPSASTRKESVNVPPMSV